MVNSSKSLIPPLRKTMPYRSHEEKLEYNRQYHARRRANDPAFVEAGKQRNKRHYAKNMALMNSHKTPCVICGESEPVCIDFHHRDESTKVSEVATLHDRILS